ncbi:MAG: MFS transporter [Paracoccaceae bacterium]
MTDTPHSSRPFLWADPAWRAVVAAFAFNGLFFGTWAARIPAFKDKFDLDPQTLGLLLLGLAAGAIVSFPVAGTLSERLGAARLTVLCAWAYGPVFVALAFAPSPIWLAFALLAFGAVHGGMDVVMNAWGAKVETDMGRSTMSIFHALFSVGAGLGAASGYVAARLGMDPTAHFLIVAGAGALVSLPLMIPVARNTLPDPQAGGTPMLALPSRSLILVGLIAFTSSMGEGAMADWSAVFLLTVAEATEAEAALCYTVFSVAMVVVRLMGGVVIARLGPVFACRASAATAFLGLMISIFGGSQALIYMGFALVGMGYAVIMPLAFSRAANDPKIRPGPALAGVATLGYGGLLLGPPIIGFLAQAVGIRLSFLALAALTLLAMVLASQLRMKAKA